ncbi:MAG: hypothetical protein ACOZHQ_04885 [Thermodesulfobacteriota bacterium]
MSPISLALSSIHFSTSSIAVESAMGLKEALLELIGHEECFLTENRIEENGKVFSLRRINDEEIVGIRADNCLLTPQAGLACDAIFFIHSPSENRLVIVLVELKGEDVGHAIKQIMAVRDYLAGKVGCNSNRRHGSALLTAMDSPAGLNHGTTLLGVVVSDRNFRQIQQEKAKALKRGVRLTKSSHTKGIDCGQLFAWQSA